MSTENKTTTTLTDFEPFLLFLCGAVELFIYLFGIPLSITNLILVARTSVIHPNMKFILLFQSFVVLLHGFCRFIICLFKFILWDPISAESGLFFPAIIKIAFFGIYSRNYVPHILIIERILATVFVRTYEQHQGFLFTIIWLPFALTISFYIAFTSQAESVPPLTNLLTTFVEFVIGTVELAIFKKLCHPFLKRNFFQFLNRLGKVFALCWRPFFHRNQRIGDQTATNAAVCTAPHGTVASAPAVEVGIAQRDLISGKALIDQLKQDEHFAMLNQAWEMKSIKATK
ncbi:hypothetical protein niasHT_038624 [Heterodera trifolii]|uniref:Uncharacterized protein n=1 Tax=Heterodera trifolii TaxID=157864 RepID=A0ABD2I2Z6_9BILA